MEIIDYTPPASWDDKGMDWSNPDPANIDYIMAIRQAIIERASVSKFPVSSSLLRLSPYVPLNTNVLSSVQHALDVMSESFVDSSFTNYQTDGSDFPKMHDYDTLIIPDDCRICTLPPKGATLEHFGSFLLSAKKIIDNFTVVKNIFFSGSVLSRDGRGEGSPSVAGTIRESIQKAIENEPGIFSFINFPQIIYNKTGTTNFNYYPSYSGHVMSQALRIVMDAPPILDSKCKIIIATFAGKVTGMVNSNAETQYNDYEKGPMDVPEGMDIRDFGEWSQKLELDFGDVDYFPGNPQTPSSKWDSPSVKRGACRGCEVKIHCLLDFGIEGGFKFQK